MPTFTPPPIQAQPATTAQPAPQSLPEPTYVNVDDHGVEQDQEANVSEDELNSIAKIISEESRDVQTRIPEARAIMFATFIGAKTGSHINITIRGEDPIELIDTYVGLVKYASSKYNLFLEEKPQLPVYTAPPPVYTVAPLSQGVSASATVPAPPNGGNPAPMPMHVAKITVTPRPDGKMRIEIFGDDRRKPYNQWSDMSLFVTPTDAVKFFAPVGSWTTQHFQSACEYMVDFWVNWEYSKKLNSKGNPYRNPIAVYP